MASSTLHLLKTRRFLPLFVTQFLGAFNDNLFKNALVMLMTYKLLASSSFGPSLVALAAAVFILPYFLFSAFAGQLADKFEKSRQIRLIKFMEIVFMTMAIAGFYWENLIVLFVTLFLMGSQSTFFSPLKYSILPLQLKEKELISGNGLIEAGTFLAILLGTIVGGALILTAYGILWIGLGVLTVAVFGFTASFFIPKASAASPALKLNYNIYGNTSELINYARQSPRLFLTMLGNAWFYFLGMLFLANFPAFGKETLQIDEFVVTFFLSIFSIGIGLGSVFCNKLLKGEVTSKFVPVSAMIITIFIFDLFFVSQSFPTSGTELMGLSAFLTTFSGWHIVFDLLIISFFGGLYVVPLYALIQIRSDPNHRARVIACTNILSALFMSISALGSALLLFLQVPVSFLFLAAALLNAVATYQICKILPQDILKSFSRMLLTFFYRVEVKGLENYNKAGKKAVIVLNHVSFLDAALVATFLPGKPLFSINDIMARNWWVKPFLYIVYAFPMSPVNPMAIRTLIEKVRDNNRCIIFPEGRLTVTGSLMKMYDGPGMIADKADAPIIPIRIEGAQYTYFTRLKGLFKKQLFPRIMMEILPPQKMKIPKTYVGRHRRQKSGQDLYHIMVNMMYKTSDDNRTFWQALLDARKHHGSGHIIAEDLTRSSVKYRQLCSRSFILGSTLQKTIGNEENVGMLLPNTLAFLMTFFGLQSIGRVPALLNYSTGFSNILAACKAAKIKTIITSSKFIEMAKLDETLEKIKSEKIKILFLEDVKIKISLRDKIEGLFHGVFSPQRFLNKHAPLSTPEKPAVILFTSGSEGIPKGVVLSHRNILANNAQILASIDITSNDRVFNALPLFHAFGLTVGTMLPLFSGVKTFLYPSPLHYRIVPELVYDTNSTLFFGTDTFLSGYARFANPYDFYSLRYVFAGAEKLKDETRDLWQQKFGLRILEGYGATETSPVLAINTPMQYKSGTVGPFLPGIEFKLSPVPGIESQPDSQTGRLSVKGSNIMKGYLRVEKPGVLEPPKEGWYDTGDVIEIDPEGFVAIKGRVKRFAKVGGEMISLTAVENFVSKVWPDFVHGIISQPDPKKGEQLILVTDYAKADRSQLITAAKEKGFGELGLPRTIIHVEKMPLLSTGKVDYQALKNFCKN